jgi:hypothetical protein
MIGPTEIHRENYCVWAQEDLHDPNNCGQCELLRHLFLRVRAAALLACDLYRGNVLLRTEEAVSTDIKAAIGELRIL